MRAPLEWLKKYVCLPAGTTPEQIAEALIRIGHEVEGVHTPPLTDGLLVVGHVREITELTEFKKPIRYCRVTVGAGNGELGPDGETTDERGIICGARNFNVGDLVVVALPGTTLPGDFTIASRSTYGHISDGMICSAAELGVGADHDGIIVLDADDPEAVVGSDARDLVGANDTVLELAVTPDRGYALSIRGLARELSAAFAVPFIDPAAIPLQTDASGEQAWPVSIDDPTGCDRFVAVRVTGIDPQAPSPFWIRRRLQACGIRAISLAVDVTNYVMLELGQPLHAFDTAKLQGPIVVRRAATDETLETLDAATRTLRDTDLVVADESGAISVAGVMGGAGTEISESTTDVLIEGAHWTPPVISRTARRLKLPSEASRRFERAVDPAVTAVAAEAAAILLARYGGGVMPQIRTDVGVRTSLATVVLPISEPERIVGRPFGPGVAAKRLTEVGCTIEARADESGSSILLVTPPSWRPDLTRPADLVEEIARLEGYDSIDSVLPVAPAGSGLTAGQRRERVVAADLASAGLVEVLSFPFVGDKDFDQLGLPAADVRRRAAVLRNPLDAEKAQMRTTLLPGLLDVLHRNLSRGVKDLALYELGLVFLPGSQVPKPPTVSVAGRPTESELAVLKASVPDQPQHVAAVAAGNWERAGWWGKGRAVSWSDAIELARRIGRTAGVELRVVAAENAPWHPGRCAGLRVGDWPVGYAGELHPAVIERLDLPPRTVALELNLSGLPIRVSPVPPAISAFPAVNLDVALVVDAGIEASAVTDALAAGGGELLESVRLFDVYTGSQVPEGKKSLAFALVVRSVDRTLTAAEANEVRDGAIALAADRAGAVIR